MLNSSVYSHLSQDRFLFHWSVSPVLPVNYNVSPIVALSELSFHLVGQCSFSSLHHHRLSKCLIISLKFTLVVFCQLSTKVLVDLSGWPSRNTLVFLGLLIHVWYVSWIYSSLFVSSGTSVFIWPLMISGIENTLNACHCVCAISRLPTECSKGSLSLSPHFYLGFVRWRESRRHRSAALGRPSWEPPVTVKLL